MKVDVTKERVAITQCHVVTEGEYCVNECEFQLPECFNGLTVTAVFNDIPVPLLNNRCYIPSLKKGGAVLGVYAYRKNGDNLELMYSPKPTAFYVEEGSYTGLTQVEKTPEISKYEEYCTMLAQVCENLISQIDYIEKSSLTESVSAQSTHSQVATAKAVYDNGSLISEKMNEEISVIKKSQIDFMEDVSNALKGKCSGEKIVVDDVSPFSHKVECEIDRKNILPVSTIGDFVQIKTINFNTTFPGGVYSFSAVVESDDTDAVACLVAFTLNGAFKKTINIARSVDGQRVAVENISVPSAFDGMYFYASVNNAASIGDKAKVYDIQLEKGGVATEYAPYADYNDVEVIVSGKNLCHITEFECVPSVENGVSYKTLELKTTLPAGCYSFGGMVASDDASDEKFLMLLFNKKDDGTTDEVGYYYFTKDNDQRVSIENQNVLNPFNFIKIYSASDADSSINVTAFFSEFQIEFGSVATEFEEFKDLQVFKINEHRGVDGIASIYPTTAIAPAQKGFLANVIYNRDINKVVSKLEEAIAI